MCEGRNGVAGFCQVCRNPLAERLAKVEPQPNLASLQVDEHFRVNVPEVMMPASMRWLDPVEPLIDVKLPMVRKVLPRNLTPAETSVLTEQRACSLRRERM